MVRSAAWWPELSPPVRVLAGAPIGRARADAQLGYGLAGPHTAAIVRSGSGAASEQLEAAAEAVVRAGGAPG